MVRPLALSLVLALLLAPAVPACAGTNEVIRIGVLTDLSGSMASAAGRGSIEAATMAAEDASTTVGMPVTIVTGDYQSRGDLAQHISEDWIKRQNIDMVVDVPNVAIAAQLQELFRNEGKILLTSAPRRPEDAPLSCGGNGVHWFYDRETLTANLVRSLVAEGKKRWFILGGDSSYATFLASASKSAMQQYGAEIAGEAYLGQRLGGLSAIAGQIRKAEPDVVFLAFGRPEVMHLLRHWPAPPEGLVPPFAFVSLLFSDLYDLKDDAFPPFYTLTSFYWDQNEATRAFSDRFAQRNRGMMPTAIHAAVYSAVQHYLHAVAAARGKAADMVLAQMRARPLQDSVFSGGSVRNDGVVISRLNLILAKKPEDRTGPFDLFQTVRSLPPAELVLPPEASCPGTADPAKTLAAPPPPGETGIAPPPPPPARAAPASNPLPAAPAR